jgi:NTP pyrophosphatase (non-canonical NTP hydrolase)
MSNYEDWVKHFQELLGRPSGIMNRETFETIHEFPRETKMDNNEYIKEVKKTEALDCETIRSRLIDEHIRLLHASMGVSTEANEILDAVKKYLFYGKAYSKDNIVEELGDMLWYIAAMCDMLGVSIEQVQASNIKKLRIRYGESFSENKAINRDVSKEYQECHWEEPV